MGWIDFSSEHRDRVRTVLDLLATPGVVDELGIGVIRDSFADRLFPGISTIQTRAKYFLTVPRILKDYEELPDRSRRQETLSDYLWRQEMLCRIRLVEKYGKREHLGIVGVTFGTRDDVDVLRQPSSVYWNGLRTFGIVKTDLSLAEFCRKCSGHRLTLRALLQETREERGDDADADDVALSPVIPLPNPVVASPEEETWLDRLTITLGQTEAEFLRQQMTATQPESLLGQILMDGRAASEFLRLRQNAPFGDLAELPFVVRLRDRPLQRDIHLAMLFSDILRGTHIRYNCLLQKRFGEEALKRDYEHSWAEWRERMCHLAWNGWDTETMWDVVATQGGQVRPWTRVFVNQWMEYARSQPASDTAFDGLVVKQEWNNKRKRARLRPDNQDESVSGWIGLDALNYRLPQAWRIVTDIIQAEAGKADANVGF